jgi:hypothetical protein
MMEQVLNLLCKLLMRRAKILLNLFTETEEVFLDILQMILSSLHSIEMNWKETLANT